MPATSSCGGPGSALMSASVSRGRALWLRLASVWWLLLGLCAAALTVLDTLLISRTTNLFIGGFLVPEPRWTTFHFAAFVAASVAFDATVILGVWLIALPLLRPLRLAPRQRLALGALLGLGPLLAILYARYQLSRYLGDLIDANLLLALAGGSPVEWFAQASAQLVPIGLTLVLMSAVAFLFVRLLREKNEPAGALRGLLAAPSYRDLALAFGLGVLVAGGVLLEARHRGGADYDALGTKTSGMVLAFFWEHATDFDLDGYGMFSSPVDQAPFDAAQHPYALDVPGNGIDENGLAGDHPLDFRAPPSELSERPIFGWQPNVLIVFLESMRADMVEARLGGREVMPFLNKLAREGGHSDRMFANSPYTALSRAQLLGGRLVPYGGQTTLIDDFKRNGYEVAWFSGQDESFGLRESAMLGQARADVHYDARDDAEHTVSAFRTSGSIQVSWKRVNEKVGEYLDARHKKQPLLLYVNYGDSHYPYDHREMDDVLGVPRLPRGQIEPQNKDAVYATYANAAANVDRAIEQLVARWSAAVGPGGAVLVTSDHGEALFDTGTIGHGLSLDATNTRVPLVVWGLGGNWPEPIGMSDLRAALQRALQVAPEQRPPRARFAVVPGRHLFQYMALIERPRLLCLRSADSQLRFDTAVGKPRDEEDFKTLIRWWESLQSSAAERIPGG